MIRRQFVVLSLTTAAFAAGAGAAAHADELQDIKSKSVLTVGVKADYPPFGYRAPSGDIIGVEPDLAADVAKRLGVKLQLVPVVAANRMQFLDSVEPQSRRELTSTDTTTRAANAALQIFRPSPDVPLRSRIPFMVTFTHADI